MAEHQHWLRLCRSPGVVKRALTIALTVGPLLTIINQFEALFGREHLNLWQAGLTFVIPYCVSTVAAVSTVREQERDRADP